MARADLPLAVGPAKRMVPGNGCSGVLGPVIDFYTGFKFSFMTNVITLVSNHTSADNIRNAIDAVRQTLKGKGLATTHPKWLSEDEACDIMIEETRAPDYDQLIENICDGFELDYCIQSNRDRRKKLLIADMDSTIITVECIVELADFVGLRDEVSDITEKAMRGEIEFKEAFRERVRMMKGLSEDVLHKAYNERVTVTAGAKQLVSTMKAHGAYTALVSGGFSFFTSRVRTEVGFDMDESNELLFGPDGVSGEVQEPILDSNAKLSRLCQLRDELQLKVKDVLAVGDGANDIPMINEAGLGVAFWAKPTTAAAANASVKYGDLSTILFYQGYSRAEFK